MTFKKNRESNKRQKIANQNNNRTIKLVSAFIILIGIFAIGFTLMNNNKITTPPYDENSPVRVGAVTLTVSDLENMSEFYQDVIGFQLLESENERVLLTTDGENPLLILEEQKDAVNKPVMSTGLYHFALLLPDEKTLGQYLIHLSESIYLQGAADHQYSKALYLVDPEGNGIEIYADIPSNKWIEDGKGGYVGATNQLDVVDLFNLAKDEEWSGLPSNTKMGHMHLQVSDLEKSEKFYVDLLGFNIVAKSDSHLFVSKDGYHHHIGMNIWLGKDIPSPPFNTKGLKHFTVLLEETEWMQVKENFIKESIYFVLVDNTIEVDDPAGIRLHIINKYKQ